VVASAADVFVGFGIIVEVGLCLALAHPIIKNTRTTK
jgi:hypothetical protein